MRILLIEDDRKAARLLGKGLHEEGFLVDVAHSGEEGDEIASATDYDLIVLDWLLPGKDGLAVCRDLRGRGVSTPILMLTARDAVTDRVRGLNTGADDYLTKPFVLEELLARIHALLRRSDLSRSVMLSGQVIVALGSDETNAIVAVSDSGPGVAPEEITRIFDRFYRGAASRTSEASGVGLGLAICRALLQAEGGQISVARKPGGTTFSIRLPLAA